MINFFDIYYDEKLQNHFLIWLFENYDSDDCEISDYSKKFIFKLLEINEGKISHLNVQKEYIPRLNKKIRIDIMVDLVVDNNKYLIVIEDKYKAGIYNPLKDYVDAISNERKKDNLEIKFWVVKTSGSISIKDKQIIDKSTFKLFQRNDFKVLKGSNNQIINLFYNKLFYKKFSYSDINDVINIFNGTNINLSIKKESKIITFNISEKIKLELVIKSFINKDFNIYVLAENGLENYILSNTSMFVSRRKYRKRILELNSESYTIESIDDFYNLVMNCIDEMFRLDQIL